MGEKLPAHRMDRCELLLGNFGALVVPNAHFEVRELSHGVAGELLMCLAQAGHDGNS